ncbi:MAG: hypothetical protein MMC23_004756 [Stictis urceolatum]|nr:hypothetical protein [Stictis urceolata]
MTSWPSPPPVRVINGKKTFIPLENNPTPLANLSTLLGVTGLTYHDVLSLTDLSVFPIPRPAHALIFIAHTPAYNAVRASDPHLWGPQSTSTPPFPLSGPSSHVVWFRQTIGHACGSMALLHALANGRGRQHISPASPLTKILAEAESLEPEPRAKLLYDSEELERAHMTAAATGDTAPPDPSEANHMHFICFVKGDDGHLWELEGGWSGPVDRGALEEGEDVLSERAVRLGPGRYLEKGREIGEENFSCVAVVEESG